MFSAVLAPTAVETNTAQWALDTALSGTTVVAIVLDGRSGRPIAMERAEEAGRLASAPGSTLKPFFLAAALRRGRVRADTTVVCRGNLRIAGRALGCTHPRDENVLDAERALAYSCNAWFASLATRFAPEQAAAVLREYGFGTRTGLMSGESAGVAGLPANAADLQLFVLGLENVEVTPAQLARAYFQLSQQFGEAPVVERGLEASVAYGMAHNAATADVIIAGKTGTASDAGQAWTHGWFAGIASRGPERVVVAIYVPRGNGADAALLAHRFFEVWGRGAAR
ncbi:MAG: penicillin-binding transpeptidase domain-containing protein [Acidobacteriaceae bacterium]